MASKKSDNGNGHLPAVTNGSFNLAVASDFQVSPELLAEIDNTDFTGYESTRVFLPIVSIRQKDLKDEKGKTLFNAGGFRIYDPVTASSNIVIADQETLTLTFLIEHSTRAYWTEGNLGDPDCRAADGKFGIGNPGGDCATCPLAQWNGDKRPACNLNANVLAFDHNANVCYVVRFGRSGLKPWSFYKEMIKRMAGGQIPVHAVIATLSTQYETEPAPYYKPVLTITGQVDLDKFRLFKKFRQEYLDVLKRTASVEAVVEEHETTAAPTGDPGGELPPGVTRIAGHEQVAREVRKSAEQGPFNDNKEDNGLPF